MFSSTLDFLYCLSSRQVGNLPEKTLLLILNNFVIKINFHLSEQITRIRYLASIE